MGLCISHQLISGCMSAFTHVTPPWPKARHGSSDLTLVITVASPWLPPAAPICSGRLCVHGLNQIMLNSD